MTLQDLKKEIKEQYPSSNEILSIYLDMAFTLGEKSQIEKQLNKLSTKSSSNGLS